MPSFIPTYDRTSVLTGMAAVYFAPLNATTPMALPADSIALGTAWGTVSGGAWTPIGATKDGVQFSFKRDTQDIEVEEQLTPVDVLTNKVTLNVEAELSEDTLQTMKLAFGGGTITATAAGSGTIGKSELVIASDLDQLSLGFESKNKLGFFRRVLIPSVRSIADVQVAFRRADSQRTYKVSFRAVCAPEEVLIRDKTAAALP